MATTKAQVSEYSRSCNSFSGVDIKATFANVQIGELQAISYSITREKAPIYTMGSPDMRCVSRGKRGIAGTMIFVVFDRHALLEGLNGLVFQSDIDDLRPGFEVDLQVGLQTAEAVSTRVLGAAAQVQEQESILTSITSDQVNARPWYVDQIPAFDITLTAAYEYGALAMMKIFGAEILNEGSGVSIDDIVCEQQNTYIARTVMPWQWVQAINGPIAALNKVLNIR